MGLVLVTPPNTEPVDLEEMARHLRADLEEIESSYVLGLIRVGRAYAESYTRRQFVAATYRLTLPKFADRIELPRPPLIAVNSIQYIDENGAQQTLASSVYDVDATETPGSITRASGETWPATKAVPNAVEVTFRCGYGGALDVPEEARHAIKMLAAHFNEHPEAVIAPDGQMAMEVPMGARSLLDTIALVEVW